MDTEKSEPTNLDRRGVELYHRGISNQDLSADSLDTTTSFNTRWRLLRLMVHFDAAPTGQTLELTFDSKNGANYDTKLYSQTLVAADTDIYIQGEETDVFERGDELQITVTNTGTPATNVYVTVIGKEIP